MTLSLKTQNLPLVGIYIIFNIAIFLTLLNTGSIDIHSIQDYFEQLSIKDGVFFSVLTLIIIVFGGIFSNKIKILNKYLYTYIQHPTSASHVRNMEKCRDGIKAALYIKKFLNINSDIEKKYLDSLVLLFFSNSLRRGLLKKSDKFFLQIKDSVNFLALKMLPLKKRFIVVVGFILMNLILNSSSSVT